jgi:hypothetical protein
MRMEASPGTSKVAGGLSSAFSSGTGLLFTVMRRRPLALSGTATSEYAEENLAWNSLTMASGTRGEVSAIYYLVVLN